MSQATLEPLKAPQDTVVAALEGDLEQEEKLVEKGSGMVKAIFGGRDGTVAGSEIIEGMFTVGNRIHAFRNNKPPSCEAVARMFPQSVDPKTPTLI